MRILEYLVGISGGKKALVPSPLQKIIAELDDFTINKAKYILLFSHLLGRVANTDEDINPDEREAMVKILDNFANVSHQLSEMIVELTKWNFLIFGKDKNQKLIEDFKIVSTPDQQEGMIHCLLAVAEADHHISEDEIGEIKKIGHSLGIKLSHLDNLCNEYRVH